MDQLQRLEKIQGCDFHARGETEAVFNELVNEKQLDETMDRLDCQADRQTDLTDRHT